MTREQVIKGLEVHASGCGYKTPYCVQNRCPYGDKNGCDIEQMCIDAIALLKEQEPKQAKKLTFHVKTTLGYEKPIVATRYDWLCPTCESLLCRDIDVIDDNYHFCKVCGQAVKWE